MSGGLLRQTSGEGLHTTAGESVISFSNGDFVDLSPRIRLSSRTNSRVASSRSSAVSNMEGDIDDDMMTNDMRSSSVRSSDERSLSVSSTAAPAAAAPPLPSARKGSSLFSRLSIKMRNNSSLAAAAAVGSRNSVTLSEDGGPRKSITFSDTTLLSPTSTMTAETSMPPTPFQGRARNLTVEQVRRSSFLAVNRIKNENELHGARRNSVRLSEADVGLLLGRVNRISPETLRQAARDGNAQLCEALVRGGVDVNCADESGELRTPLMLAIEAGKSDCALHLINLGASVDEHRDATGSNALALACALGKVSCVQFLIQHGHADGNLPYNSKTKIPRSIFTQCLVELEEALVEENEQRFLQRSEICRIFLSNQGGNVLDFHRELFRPSTLFLVDEWQRAAKAGEELVMPPMTKVVEGETHLLRFLKQHRRRVSIMTVIKIWFVIMFIVFDLATRDMAMTPQRLLTYAFLYVGAYYT